jgi:hypothetical protein
MNPILGPVPGTLLSTPSTASIMSTIFHPLAASTRPNHAPSILLTRVLPMTYTKSRPKNTVILGYKTVKNGHRKCQKRSKNEKKAPQLVTISHRQTILRDSDNAHTTNSARLGLKATGGG